MAYLRPRSLRTPLSEWEPPSVWCGGPSPSLRSAARADKCLPGWDDRSGDGQLPNRLVRFSSVTWPGSRDPVGKTNGAAALVFSCGGKTFQQLASDSSRNICNVRHWWEPPPCSLRMLSYDNRVGGLRFKGLFSAPLMRERITLVKLPHGQRAAVLTEGLIPCFLVECVLESTL